MVDQSPNEGTEEPLGRPSMDERLSALLRTIDNWGGPEISDGEAEQRQAPRPPPSPVAEAALGSPSAAGVVHAASGPVDLATPPAVPSDVLEVNPEAPVEFELSQVAADAPAAVDAAIGVAAEVHDPSEVPVVVAGDGPRHARADAGDLEHTDPVEESDEEPAHARSARGLSRALSHPRVRALALGVAASMAVLFIIWGIRFVVNPASSAPGPTGSAAAPTGTDAHTSTSGASVQDSGPISSAELAQYNTDAQGLQTANVATSRVLSSADGTPTSAQRQAAVTSYRAAVSLYDTQLHSLHWPASLSTAVGSEELQLQALLTVLNGYASVTPTDAPGWLTTLDFRAGTAQVADNVVRGELGLPSESTFP
jgi:hypothetical protein